MWGKFGGTTKIHNQTKYNLLNGYTKNSVPPASTKNDSLNSETRT
jgi:hypothetical protein